MNLCFTRLFHIAVAFLWAAFWPSSLLAAASFQEWQFQQSLDAERVGLIRVSLTPETFNKARPDLADLRVLDPSGAESSFLIERPETPSRLTRLISNPVTTLEGSQTRLRLPRTQPETLRRLRIETPASDFLKAVTVRALARDGTALTLADRQIVYRRGGAESLWLELSPLHPSLTEIQISLDDSRSRPLPISGLTLVAVEPGSDVSLPVPARIIEQIEGSGETMLRLDFGASHLPLQGIRLEVEDSVFIRSVKLLVREWVNGELKDRTLGLGSIHRVMLEDAARAETLQVPLEGITPGRELILAIQNGDSPPLSVRSVTVLYQPTHLTFVARTTGTHQILSGHSQAAAPKYDVAGLAAQPRAAPSARVAAGPLKARPEYRPPLALQDIPILGGTLDPAGWRFRRSITLQGTGVQRLDLPLHALSETRTDRGDLRLISGNRQVLYLLDQNGYSKLLDLPATSDPVAAKPKVSRWKLPLPNPHLPVTEIRCHASTSLFDREVRIYEVSRDHSSPSGRRELGRSRWVRSPERTNSWFSLTLSLPPQSSVLWLETDNGDNAALELGTFRALVPSARLLFQSPEAGSVELVYGNGQAHPPRYDLSLVAPRVLAASKGEAKIEGPDPTASADRWSGMSATSGFYLALVLVVAGLLFLVARLLPKPAA